MNWAEIKGLDIYYDDKKIISNLNIELRKGENTVIIGSNGSGKSTILKTIARLKYPRAKENSFLKVLGDDNINIWKLRSKIGFLTADIHSRIKENVTAREVILSSFQGTFGLVENNALTRDQVYLLNNIKDIFNPSKLSTKYSELSDGEQRRVLIARSVISSPEILILDEPTAMLDVKSSFIILETLSNLAKKGITILYVTNSIDHIIKETHRVILIKEGKIVKDGSPLEVINSENISNLYGLKLSVMELDGYWRVFPVRNIKR